MSATEYDAMCEDIMRVLRRNPGMTIRTQDLSNALSGAYPTAAGYLPTWVAKALLAFHTNGVVLQPSPGHWKMP